MEWISGEQVTWADAIQAGVSFLAFLAIPQAIISIWNATRYSLKATLRPVDPDQRGASDTWQLAIRNTSYTTMRSFKATAIPVERGVHVIFALMQGGNDGGLQVRKHVLVDGGLELDVQRLGPARTAYFLVRMSNLGNVHLHSDALKVRHDRKPGAQPGQMMSLTLMHQRLMLLLLQFALGFFVIIARLLYLIIFS